jgi:hypothetical protein
MTSKSQASQILFQFIQKLGRPENTCVAPRIEYQLILITAHNRIRFGREGRPETDFPGFPARRLAMCVPTAILISLISSSDWRQPSRGERVCIAFSPPGVSPPRSEAKPSQPGSSDLCRGWSGTTLGRLRCCPGWGPLPVAAGSAARAPKRQCCPLTLPGPREVR